MGPDLANAIPHCQMHKKLVSLLDLCVSSLRRGHANLLCIVSILTDDPRKESNSMISVNSQPSNITCSPPLCSATHPTSHSETPGSLTPANTGQSSTHFVPPVADVGPFNRQPHQPCRCTHTQPATNTHKQDTQIPPPPPHTHTHTPKHEFRAMF